MSVVDVGLVGREENMIRIYCMKRLFSVIYTICMYMYMHMHTHTHTYEGGELMGFPLRKDGGA